MDTASETLIAAGDNPEGIAALYRTVIVKMRFHQSTIDYVAR